MSINSTFGVYMRELRLAQDITQEQLGEMVGKKKMTISLIENGKNAPPEGKFLDDIITALNLDGEKKATLIDLAAIERGAIPIDILDYFNKHIEMRNAIRRAIKQKIPDKEWEELYKEGDK